MLENDSKKISGQADSVAEDSTIQSLSSDSEMYDFYQIVNHRWNEIRTPIYEQRTKFFTSWRLKEKDLIVRFVVQDTILKSFQPILQGMLNLRTALKKAELKTKDSAIKNKL